MEINRNNYEVFLIDYLDGNLSPEMVAELLLFLENNHDLKEEFDGMEIVSVSDDETISFDFKDSLKKPIEEKLINKDNYEEFFIASLEGDLSKIEKRELVNFLINNSELSKEFKLFKQTFLEPETEVQFSEKSLLKKIVVETVHEIGQDNYEEYLIADLEGDLDLNKKHKLAAFLQKNPQIKKEYQLSKSTVLTPDYNIEYDNKRALKKPALPIFNRKTIYYSVSIAASILIILSIFLLQPKSPVSHQILAERKSNNATLNLNKSASDENSVEHNQPITNKNSYAVAENSVKKKYPKRNTQNLDEVNPIASPEQLAFVNSSYNQINDKREFYTSIYNETQLAEYYRDLAQNEVSNRKEYSTLADYGVKKLRKFLKRNNNDYEVSNNQFSWWEIADAGVTGFNLISNKDITLKKGTDDDGNVTSFALAGESFNFLRK